MSEQEQDLIIGRMVREHAEHKRKLVAMTDELKRYENAFKTLVSGLAYNVSSDSNLLAVQRELQKEPLSKFDFTKLLDFLQEYTELRKSIDAGTAKLNAL